MTLAEVVGCRAGLCLLPHLFLLLHQNQAAHRDDDEEVENSVSNGSAGVSNPGKADTRVGKTESHGERSQNTMSLHDGMRGLRSPKGHVTKETDSKCDENEGQDHEA